jgi:hypothetical protein
MAFFDSNNTNRLATLLNVPALVVYVMLLFMASLATWVSFG